MTKATRRDKTTQINLSNLKALLKTLQNKTHCIKLIIYVF